MLSESDFWCETSTCTLGGMRLGTTIELHELWTSRRRELRVECCIRDLWSS